MLMIDKKAIGNMVMREVASLKPELFTFARIREVFVPTEVLREVEKESILRVGIQKLGNAALKFPHHVLDGRRGSNGEAVKNLRRHDSCSKGTKPLFVRVMPPHRV